MALVGLVIRHAPSASVAILLSSFFVNLLTLVSPLYMLQVYDRVLPSRSEETLLLLTILICGLLAVMTMLDRARSRILNRIALRVTVDMSVKAFDAAFRRNLRRPTGGVAARLSADVDMVRQFLSGPGVPAFIDLPWAPLFIVAAYLMAPLIGHLTLGAAVILLVLTALSEIASRKPTQAGAMHGVKASSFAETSLSNAQTISAMGMLPAVRERWYKAFEDALAFQMQAADRAATLSSMSRYVRITVQSVVLGAGAWLAIEQIITPGAMIAGSIILGRGLAPIEQVVGAWRGFAGARAAYGRIQGLIEEYPPPKSGGVTLPAPLGALALEGVVIAAPDSGQPIIKGISLTIPAGQTVGIVGPSGAGKSTLARALVGATIADRGTVRVDGASMRDWPSEILGKHVGYLPQEVELFDGTVAENIARFGTLDSEKIVRAAKMAAVHDLILQLPQGYETPIGAAGRVLSGGQRQRIALARALYDDPVLLVLDEPNANLDTDGEAALVQALRQLRLRRATVVLISHRVSLIGLMERIVVMRDGVVETHGPSEEIIAKLQGKPAAPAPTAMARA
jgi:PrtD family type I secretion system ABC transporter